MESEELRRTIHALNDAGYHAYADDTEDSILVSFGSKGAARLIVKSLEYSAEDGAYLDR